MKKLFTLFLVLMLMMCMTVTAFASGTVRQGEVSGGGSAGSSAPGQYGINLTDPNATQGYLDNELFGSGGLIDKSVTTDSIVGKLEAKGSDVVSILQTAGRYVCIAGFIISCILVLVGIIGNKRLLAGAVIGLLISGIAYAGIVCGWEIVSWIAAWAVS